MSDTQRRRGQAVKAGRRPPLPSGAQRPLLAGIAAAPSPPKRAGVWLRGDASASRDLREATTGTTLASTTQRPPAPGRREPLGGRTGRNPARPVSAANGPQGVGGGQHDRQRAAPDWNACGFGTADTALAMAVGAKPCATPRERWAWRCRARGARHNGGCVQRDHQAKL